MWMLANTNPWLSYNMQREKDIEKTHENFRFSIIIIDWKENNEFIKIKMENKLQ